MKQARVHQSYGTLSRTAFLGSDAMVAHAPGLDSPLWWPARAMLGEAGALLTIGLLCIFLARARRQRGS